MARLAHLLIAGALALAPAAGALGQSDGGADGPSPAQERAQMLDGVRAQVTRTAPVTGRGELAEPVMQAMATVPRHNFVPPALRHMAYANQPVPVGHGQTISQPFVVALMLELAEIAEGDKVLIVGMGGGYMAAVASEMGAAVFGVEIKPKMARQAAHNLGQSGYGDPRIRIGDNYYGWPSLAPFDAILIRHAVPHVPEPLANQLAEDGRLVAPVGPPEGRQELTVQQPRAENGRGYRQESVLPVRFTILPGGQRT